MDGTFGQQLVLVNNSGDGALVRWQASDHSCRVTMQNWQRPRCGGTQIWRAS